ncbi:MAG: cell envelope integrity protein CreD [Prevotellaceae bacterium]|jgi:inner membrane protein|nr:cell envelope integrity protein CreD [Prevotellaceae bacterium]
METKKNQKFTQSITFKALTVVVLTLLLLIPKAMITGLIEEREKRSKETVRAINEKWSNAQTICGPVISVPYSVKIVEYEKSKTGTSEKVSYQRQWFSLMPSTLRIDAKLLPEPKHYGIYKTVLYKSELDISGSFDNLDEFEDYEGNNTKHWNEAYITIGITDLKGLVSNAEFSINGKAYAADAQGSNSWFEGNTLKIQLKNFQKSPNGKNEFRCTMTLNGSSDINFIPVGRTTDVSVSGRWGAPSFIGNFSPESEIGKVDFTAKWHILHFNRNIPEAWDGTQIYFADSQFGVQLIETVDHYQQNLRSAKYALMFIALTFMVFFFVEVLTKKKIHIIQYLLVGIALILFYSLLLSISEQIGFALAYLIASLATIGLISAYVYSIFKSSKQTSLFTLILCILYIFLYVILQLEDLALLIGSVVLFAILGTIMFLSRKINWYKDGE